jgi:diguanylate cyclase (GGDEF)-like protein
MSRSSLSLSRRLFYSHLLCALAIATAVAAYLYWAISSDLVQADQRRLKETATAIGERLKGIDFASPDAPTTLDNMLREAQSTHQLSAAMILRSGQRWIGTNNTSASASNTTTQTYDALPEHANFQLLLSADNSALHARLTEVRNYALLGFIGAVILALLFARIIARRMERTLDALVDRFQLLASGRFDARVQETGNDQLGRLAAAFNDMSERLQRTLGERERTLEQLRVARDQLEASMRDRTKELVDLNVLLRQEHEQRARMEANLAEAAATDPLTQLLNRRSMLELIRHIGDAMRKNSKNCCFAILDIDLFKQVNDRYGHDVGDQVLSSVSNVIRQHLRADEAAARWGGEEFLLVWPDQSLMVAEQRADRLRELIADCSFASGTLKVTASFGVAEWSYSEALELALKRSDKALYAAKAEGRNRVKSLKV